MRYENKIDFLKGMLFIFIIAIGSYTLGRYVPAVGAGGFAHLLEWWLPHF